MIANDLFKQSLRLARITLKAGRQPATTQLAECLTAGNSMLGSWGANRLTAYQIVMEAFPLTAGVNAYTIGVSGTFNTARPQRIERANLLTSADHRLPIEVIDVDHWSAFSQQEAQGQPDTLYNDRGSPVSTLRFNRAPDQHYPIELYSWKPFTRFLAGTDPVTLPPEYEEAFVYNLALRLAALDGKLAQVDSFVRDTARLSLAELESLNAPSPVLSCDAAVLSQDLSAWDWRTNR